MKKISIIVILVFIICSYGLSAQIKGELPERRPDFNPDTIFTFISPRPLVIDDERSTLDYAWGIDLLFSESGFGLGGFIQRKVNDDLAMMLNLYISGSRNTDEFEVWNGESYIVPGKIRRIFILPLMMGAQYFVFKDQLADSFRPFIESGIGPTLVYATPYHKEFFSSLMSPETYVRFGAYGGVGATIGSVGESLMKAHIRFYYIPFGGEGIESVIDNPIHNLGGVYLSISVGMRY